MALTDEQRSELSKWAQSRTLPAGDVFRGRLILALSDGASYSKIMQTLQTTAPPSRAGNSVLKNKGWKVWIRVTKAASHGLPRRLFRIVLRARRNRNPPTDLRIGPAGRWRTLGLSKSTVQRFIVRDGGSLFFHAFARLVESGYRGRYFRPFRRQNATFNGSSFDSATGGIVNARSGKANANNQLTLVARRI